MELDRVRIASESEMIHPAKVGQFIGGVLVVLTFMERECSWWDRGTKLHFTA